MKNIIETSLYLFLMAFICFISIQFISMNQRVTKINEVSGYIENYIEAKGVCKTDNNIRQVYYSLDGVSSAKVLGKINMGNNDGAAYDKNSITFEVAENKTADIKIFSMSADSETDSVIGIFKSTGEVVSTATSLKNKDCGTAENPLMCTLSAESLEPGVYYIGSPAGQRSDIYYIEAAYASQDNTVSHILTSGINDGYFKFTKNVSDIKNNIIYYKYNENNELISAAPEDITSEDVNTFPILTDEITEGLFKIAQKYDIGLKITYKDTTNNYVYIDYELTYNLSHPLFGFNNQHTYTGLLRFSIME